MRFVIYGAGGIGGTIGARLHQQGADVVFIARGEHGEVMQSRGLRLVAPEGETQLKIPVVQHPRELRLGAEDSVLLCMKSQHTLGALEDLLRAGGADVAVICAQNGVANERMALRRFQRTYAMLVTLPAVHLVPGEVVTHARGRGGILDMGCYPGGIDETVTEVTGLLEQAGFSAEPDAAVMRKKYAKLLMNLSNALMAATEMLEGAEEIVRMLRTEALACYEAAGLECATPEETRARHEGVYEMVEIPGHPWGWGSSWQSVARGTGNIEVDYLNGEIVLLGRLHGIPTPANSVCQRLAWRMVSEGLSVGHFEFAEVKAMIAEAESTGVAPSRPERV